MASKHTTQRMLTIGEFARLTHLSVKALRVYEEAGLVRPAEVDPASGYRRYRHDQGPRARLIALLRGVDLSLAEIGALLVNLDTVPAAAVEDLDRHLRRLESQHASRRVLIRHIRAMLHEEEPSMFTIQTRHVPAQRVMSIQRRVCAHETDAFVAEAKHMFSHHLDGRRPTGPFTIIFHGIVDFETPGPIEAALGCPDDVMPSELVGIRTEVAHDEAFTPITKAQWAYPAILAAYDAVAASPEAIERPGRLACREVYRADPDDIDDDDLVCDIAFPLG